MVSETVDPIDWSHPPPSWAVPPEHLMHSINQCNLTGNRMSNCSMRGNHLADADTLGIKLLNQLFSSGPIVMRLQVTLPVLSQLFSSGTLHIGVTNCYWGNFISGSVLNQSFCSGAIVMHLGPWGNSLFLW